MLVAALVMLPFFQSPSVERDDYGVPHIKASTVQEAWRTAGYACAQDRLWQMENSRRVARGQMAEAFGTSFVASDKEVLQTGYTDVELQHQFDNLAPRAKEAITSYTDGVNAWIAEVTKRGLPEGYANNHLTPRPWTVIDSVAIAVRLFDYFGRGGAGEIRNLALLSYLDTRPNLKGRVLDVFDDFAWLQDSSATCTLRPEDDRQAKNPPHFYYPTRADTERQLASIPKLGLFELLPGVNLAMRRESTLVAQSVAAPFKVGSYCVVVGGNRSATGQPILLSAPQMGFQSPSIVHEMSISAPSLQVAGMDVPGIPGVLIGYTPQVAWGLTSGVADTDDIFFYKADGQDGYFYGSQRMALEKIQRTLKVSGGPDQTITQTRTLDGPVVVRGRSAPVLFARKSSYWGKEMQSYEALMSLYSASTTSEIEKGLDQATMSFNFFYATRSGDIGWKYLGLVPVRADGLDPRLPTPGEPKYAWRGLLTHEQMPSVRNPKSGLIANWNNKPVSWWPNGDTPVWGRIFRNTAVLGALEKPKLNTQDVELAAWTIARTDETWPYMRPHRPSTKDSELLVAFDGRLIDGSYAATAYQSYLKALRDEVFLSTTGNFMSPDYFELVAQPTTIDNALAGRTRVNYLGKRTRAEVESAAIAKASASAPSRYAAPGIRIKDAPRIAYSNRGTYIQIIDFLATGLSGRNVLPPGEAETGPHSQDQVPLSRQWTYKPF